MATRALYFPYIKTPEGHWFTRVLLYWDAVGTILPGGLDRDPRFVTRRMQELSDQGLLEFVSPLFDFEEIPRFREEFIRYLDVTAGQGRSQPLKQGTATSRVHAWKLGGLAQDLIDRGLAAYADGPGWELWLDVEQGTAAVFMAYLAVTLGSLAQLAMDPVTDTAQAMLPLWDTASALQTEVRARRFALLEDLLPAPAKAIGAKDLKRFKDDHQDELAAFRDAVDEELIKIASLTDRDVQDEQARLSAARLSRQRDEIGKLIARKLSPQILFGAVGALAAAGFAVAGPLVVHRSPADAAFAAPGLIPAIHAAVSEVRKRPDWGTRPMAYAALAQKKFVG